MIRGRGLIGVAVMAVTAGLLVGIAEIGPVGTAILGAAIVCVTPFLVGMKRGQQDIFEPSYLFAVSFGVLFVIRPLLEWSSTHGVPTMGGLDPTPTYLAAIVVALLGGLAFYAGYYSPVGRRLAARLSTAPTGLDNGRVRIGVLSVTVTGIALYAAFLSTSGGLGALAAVISGRNQDYVLLVSQPAGYLYSGLSFLFPAGLILLVTARSWKSLTGLAGMTLVAASVGPAFFAGTRSATLPALLTLILLWYLRRGARPRLVSIITLALAGFVLVISVPRDFRNTDDRTSSLVDAVASSVSNAQETGRQFFLGLDTAMLPALAIELSYVPEVIPYQLGSTYVEAAVRPIPRAFWSSKPEAADTQLMRVLWPDLAAQRVGLAFSLFGEPYLNFGFPGVIAISSIFGVAWRSLWEYWRRQPQNMVAIGIYVISWPFLFVYIRGGIGVDYQRQLIALVPFIALAWFGSRHRGARDQADTMTNAFSRVHGRIPPHRRADLTASGRAATREP